MESSNNGRKSLFKKAFYLAVLVFIIAISSNNNLNNGGSSTEPTEITRIENKINDTDEFPIVSGSHSYSLIPLERNFTDTTYIFPQQERTEIYHNSTYGYYFISYTGLFIFNGSANITYMQNLANESAPIYRAQISGVWASNMTDSNEGILVQVCNSTDLNNDENWYNITSNYVRPASTPTEFTYYMSNVNITTVLYVRYRIFFEAGFTERWATIHSLNVRVFTVNVIEVNNTVIEGDVDKKINIILTDYNIVNRTEANIRLYFSNTSTVTGTSPYVNFEGTYPNYNTTIPEYWYNGTGTMYYRLRFINGTNEFWTNVNSFQYDDFTTPKVDNITILTDPVIYNQSVNFSIGISDKGGSFLDSVEVRYKMGSGGIENSLGTQNIAFGINTNVTNWTVPYYSVSAKQGEELIITVYVRDRKGNQNNSFQYTVYPNDFDAPIIAYLEDSIPTNRRIQYDVSTFTIRVHINEHIRGSGFALNGTGLQLRYKINGTPSNDNDFHHVIVVSPSELAIYERDYEFNLIPELGGNLTMNDTAYFWIHSRDVKGNIYTNYSQALYNNFTIADDLAPEVIEHTDNFKSAGYDSDKIFNFTIRELVANGIQPGGVNESSIKFEFQVNGNFTGAEQSVALMKWATDQYSFTILKGNYSFNDTIYFRLTSADNWGNTIILGIYQIIVSDIYAPVMVFNQTKGNTTIARTEYDLKIVISGSDYPGGVGMNPNSTIKYRFGSALVFDDIAPSQLVSEIQGEDYIFIILAATLNAAIMNNSFYYAIRTWDNYGNYMDINGLVPIHIQEMPFLSGFLFKGFTGENFNTDSVEFQMDITKDSIMYYTLNGTRVNDNLFVGTRLETTLNFPTQGWYDFKVYYHTKTFLKTLYVDWTAPTKVTHIHAIYSSGKVMIQWSKPVTEYEGEYLEYIIYRGKTPDFIISDGSKVGRTAQVSFEEALSESGTWYYKVVAVDLANNESPVSDPVEVTVPLSPLFFAAGIAGALILGLVGIKVMINIKNRGKTLSERGKVSKDISEYEFEASKKRFEEKPSKIEGWSDDGWGSSTSAAEELSPRIDGIDCSKSWDDDMIEFYNTAIELIELENTTDAINSLNLLLKKATEKGDEATIAFINGKIKEFYGT